jgi:DNA-binding transcriptional ArsR family regulator
MMPSPKVASQSLHFLFYPKIKPMNEQFKVRDMREKTKFYLDDIFIDEYAILVGTTATVIYNWLCRYANKNQKAWPSLAKLASNLGMNEKTIRRNLKKLENHNLILVERVGKTRSNRYHLLDQSKWTKKPLKEEKVIGHECPVTGTPMSNHRKDTQQRNKIDTNVSTASGKKDEAVQGEKENFKMVDFVTKGSNYWTEHYSAVQADVPDSQDPTTMLNTELI